MLPAELGGDMAAYVWKINGAAYPNRNSLDIREDERVGIVFTNATSYGPIPCISMGMIFRLWRSIARSLPALCMTPL
jgi:FtsP/CotA-like multicopper oxidase with cupredoxin domain